MRCSSPSDTADRFSIRAVLLIVLIVLAIMLAVAR